MFFEMLSPPLSLFHHVPHPFTWLFFSKNEVLSGTSLIRGMIPVTLFTRNAKNAVQYLASALLHRSADKSNNHILNIDRLCIFSEERSKIINYILDNILQLADQMKVNRIEIELYTEVNEPISFPSGASYLDSWNASDLPQLVKENDFISKEKRYCLTKDVSNIQYSPVKEVNTINSKQIQQYTDLNHTGRHLIKHTRKILFGPRSLASRNIALLSDPRLTLVTETKKFLQKKVNGIVNWSPNMYFYLKTEGNKALYLNLEKLIANTEPLEIGKIFNVIVDESHLSVYKQLCLGAVEQMKLLGVSKCQIGNISEYETDFLHFLYEDGFRNAQVIQLFSRTIHKT
jgi:hypothetical protein